MKLKMKELNNNFFSGIWEYTKGTECNTIDNILETIPFDNSFELHPDDLEYPCPYTDAKDFYKIPLK